MIGLLKYKKVPDKLKPFMPISQVELLDSSISIIEEHQDVIDRILGVIEKMPKTYQTEDIDLDDKIVYLHYFAGGCDWYVIEKDKGDTLQNEGRAGLIHGRQYQAFGFADLGYGAELGYISIEELIQNPMVNLDFYFKPQPWKKINNPEDFSEESDIVEESELRDEEPLLKEAKPDCNLAKSKTHLQITIEIRNLIDAKGLNREQYSMDELEYLSYYDGLGGLQKSDYVKKLDVDKKREVLDQYFTPPLIINKMWGLALKHGFDFSGRKNILEPSCGIGRFFRYIKDIENHYIRAYEIDYYSFVICKLLFPSVDVFNESFEKIFFDKDMNVGLDNVKERFDLVIGNPPYREYNSTLKNVKNLMGKTEKEITLAETFDQYFIKRGVDLLRKNGLLIFVIPSTFLSNSNKYNKFKENLSKTCELIDAYRLPSKTFTATDIATDIIVLRKL